MIRNEHVHFSVINKTLQNIYISRPLFSLVDNGVKMNFERHSFLSLIFVISCISKYFLVTQKGPKMTRFYPEGYYVTSEK